MGGMAINPKFWNGKRVLVTGHTGFKGGWLSLWLSALNAEILGFSLPPANEPNLYTEAQVGKVTESHYGSVFDYSAVLDTFQRFQPEIVFHLAAQPLVNLSYQDPVGTYAVNVMGTVHILEAVRHTQSVRTVVNITSDKCYENREWIWGYRESEPMGGHDPYSSSKGCAELVTSAYRNSFLMPPGTSGQKIGIASARAGNVIGGGDWTEGRLLPDLLKTFSRGKAAIIRRPEAIRPWQHVLEPICGYLQLAERLWADPQNFSDGWNFGPSDRDAQPVRYVVEHVAKLWGGNANWEIQPSPEYHEAGILKLDCAKAAMKLDWHPAWDLETALKATVEWHRAYTSGMNMRTFTQKQIDCYTASLPAQPNSAARGVSA